MLQKYNKCIALTSQPIRKKITDSNAIILNNLSSEQLKNLMYQIFPQNYQVFLKPFLQIQLTYFHLPTK